MAGWQDYLKFLNSLAHTLEQLTQVEQEKNTAAAQGDLLGVEECMKREQVASLTLRGLDQKRDKLLAGMGLAGVPLRDMPERAPQDIRQEVKEAAERLRRKYELFQSASDVARNTLECNLHAIEKLQKAQDAPHPEEQEQLRQSDFRA